MTPLGAYVAGFPAVLVAHILDEHLPGELARWERAAASGRVDPRYLRQMRATWEAIGEARRQWLAVREVSAGGSAEATPAETRAGSGQISADAAAGLLGVTPRRVRQLLASDLLEGRKVAGTWLVSRSSVLAYQTIRGGAREDVPAG